MRKTFDKITWRFVFMYRRFLVSIIIVLIFATTSSVFAKDAVATPPVEATNSQIAEGNYHAIGTLEVEFDATIKIVGLEPEKKKGKTSEEIIQSYKPDFKIEDIENAINDIRSSKDRDGYVHRVLSPMKVVSMTGDKIRLKYAGTGFFFNKEKPLVKTCTHVVWVDDVMDIQVFIFPAKLYVSNVCFTFIDSKEQKHKAEVDTEECSRNRIDDLGIVKVLDMEKWDYVIQGNSDLVKQGDEVYNYGSPKGHVYNHTMTKGIVGFNHRRIDLHQYEDFIQISAFTNGGNSGGPVFNNHGERGEVIGVLSATAGVGTGIYFVIPINLYEANPNRNHGILNPFYSLDYIFRKIRVGVNKINKEHLLLTEEKNREKVKKSLETNFGNIFTSELFKTVMEIVTDQKTVITLPKIGFKTLRSNFPRRVGGDTSFTKMDVDELKKIIISDYEDKETSESDLPVKEDLKAIASATKSAFAVITSFDSGYTNECRNVLKIGDVVLKIDGELVSSNYDINFYLMKNDKLPGDVVSLTILRPMLGKMHEEVVSITLE